MVPFWAIVLALVLMPAPSTGPVVGAAGAGAQAQQLAQASPDPATPVTLVSLTDGIGERTEVAVDGLLEAAGIAILTPPIPTSEFFVAGVTWDAGELLPPEIEISMRVFEHGQWSQWLGLEADGAGYGSGDEGRAGTDPFVTGGARAVQIQISGNPALLPPGLDLSLIPSNPLPPTEVITQIPAEPAPAPSSEPIAPDHGDVIAAPPPATPVDSPDVSLAGWTRPVPESGSSVAYDVAAVRSRAVAPRPAITTREQWGADAATTTWSPSYDPLKAAIVHHTAGTNSYSSDESAQIVRGIHHFHAVTRDWGDIGYNFLVDRYGQVFEGRKGTLQSGDTEMVRAAHARGFNSGSMGISAMGDFELESAPAVILDRMADVIAWKFSLAGIDVRTQSGFTSPASTYRGAGEALPRVFGHGDVAATTCPSRDIYDRLGGLRSAVESRIRSAQDAQHSPFGSLDHVHAVPGGLSLRGWAIDPDTDDPLYIWVTVDGAGRHILADSHRPDVARYYPSFSDNHGFDARLSVGPGDRRVCATASNRGDGSNRELGCHDVTVRAGSPFGNFEAARAVPGGIDISGWGIDPDTTASIYVWVTVDGRGRHLAADKPRGDIGRAYPGYGGDHGFRETVGAQPGRHRVCVTAANVHSGSDTSLLCRSVVVTD